MTYNFPCQTSETRVSTPVLTFPAILDDPMVRALMRADHVDLQSLRVDLSRIADAITAEKAGPAVRTAQSECCAC
jgi:hypothetical protein